MRKFTALLFAICCLSANATTYNVPAGASAAAMNTLFSTASAIPGNTVQFPGSAFSLASGLNIPCVNGTIYAGVPGTVLTATFTGGNLLTLRGTANYTSPGAGCTITGLNIANQNVYIIPQLSGLLFKGNTISGINGSVKGSGNTTSWAGVYVDNGTTQDIANSSFIGSTFGPSCTDVDGSITTDYNGTCGGLVIHGSNVNVTFSGNRVAGQIEELFHTLAQGTGGQISTNLTITNNDCGGVHRICIETQQGQVKNQVVRYNSVHDYFNPTPFSFGISNACCFAPNSVAPGTITANNLIVFNTPCAATYCYGYAIEAWGNAAQFTGNVIQASALAKPANPIALGGATSATSTALVATGNIVQGYSAAVVCENGGTLPSCTFVSGSPLTTGNTVAASPSALVSAVPSVTLAGAVATLADAAPNTSIYYTVDGTIPVPGSGSAQLYAAPVTLASGATIKAVGMWGSGANPLTYPAGFGYVPSAVVSATYTLPVVLPSSPVIVTTVYKPGYSATIGPDGTLTITVTK